MRRTDGLWQIVDYKTWAIPDKAETAEHNRLQLKIYNLYLAKLFPDQGTYPTVLYFTDLADIHSFNFTPTEQVVTRKRVDDLVARLILTKPHPELAPQYLSPPARPMPRSILQRAPPATRRRSADRLFGSPAPCNRASWSKKPHRR